MSTRNDMTNSHKSFANIVTYSRSNAPAVAIHKLTSQMIMKEYLYSNVQHAPFPGKTCPMTGRSASRRNRKYHVLLSHFSLLRAIVVNRPNILPLMPIFAARTKIEGVHSVTALLVDLDILWTQKSSRRSSSGRLKYPSSARKAHAALVSMLWNERTLDSTEVSP